MKDSELPQIPQADPRRRFLARRREIEGAIARVLERGTSSSARRSRPSRRNSPRSPARGTQSRSLPAPMRCALP
jgi:hypothetical protein